MDSEYVDVGVEIVVDYVIVVVDVDVVFKVCWLYLDEFGLMKVGVLVLVIMDFYGNEGDVEVMGKVGIMVFVMEFMFWIICV